MSGSALDASRVTVAHEAALNVTSDESGALVRLPIGSGPWAESLPPAPDGHRVTVSFSSPALAEEHGEAVRLLGYVVVNGPDDEDTEPLAWLVVPAALARSHPRWLTTIRSRADAVYHLGMGPVLRRFAAVLRPHFP